MKQVCCGSVLQRLEEPDGVRRPDSYVEELVTSSRLMTSRLRYVFAGIRAWVQSGTALICCQRLTGGRFPVSQQQQQENKASRRVNAGLEVKRIEAEDVNKRVTLKPSHFHTRLFLGPLIAEQDGL